MSQDKRPLTYKFYQRRPRKKRRKLPPIKTIQNKLEIICKILIRKIYGNVCYTCGADKLLGRNWHTGHLIPRSTCGTFLKWDLRNLRPQCTRCNIWLGGNGAIFYKRMVEREGQRYVDDLFADRSFFIKERDRYPQLLKQYERMLHAPQRKKTAV